jgi:glycosyltransferase involved in cell wall biosynthesis
MQVVYNGVADRPGERARVRRELGLRDDELLVLAVGSLCPRKGHPELLEALATLPREIPWRVAIAGVPTDGEQDTTPELQRIIAGHGLEGRAHLLGPRGDVPDLLAAADVFAMPSHWEGHPMAMLEAMFARRAIVASRVGGIPEAVHDDVHAVLAPAKDVPALAAALRRVLTDAPLRERLGDAARARADETFSVRAMADAYEALYRGERLN